MSNTGTSDPSSANLLSFSLNVRIDRPVAECEMAANAHLTTRGGSLDNQARSRVLENSPHAFEYQWFRGPRKPYCSSFNCPRVRAATHEPSKWSKAAIGSLSYICGVCERAGVRKFDSTFCSLTCFKEGWRRHSSECHSNLKFHFSKFSDLSLQDTLDIAGGNESGISNNINNNSNSSSSSLRMRSSSSFDSGNDDNGITWELVSSEKQYKPSTQDIGCVLKLEVSAISTGSSTTSSGSKILAGPVVTYTEPVLAPPKPPPKRSFITVGGALNGVTRVANFRVVSYNILADLYATKQMYPHCDAWTLTWPFRRRMLLHELSESQGDILCLQEVQSDHYEQHILPFMESLGYDGLYKMKSREGGGIFAKVDGCATFWRRSKFAVVENYVIDFNESARRIVTAMNLDDNESRKYINRLHKDNIAQVIFLEILSTNGQSSNGVGVNGVGMNGGSMPFSGSAPNSRLPRGVSGGVNLRNCVCVTNTHLYSNPRNPDVKLWQTLTLISELEQIIQSRDRDVPLFICGDFNSEPDSAVYEFLAEGQIDRHHPEIDESDNLRILPDLHQVGHSLGLQSMMKCALTSEPAFTNYTTQFKGTLDYIWFTPSRLRVMAVSSIPLKEQLTADNLDGGLPNTSYPSDHIMLCCDMAVVVNPNLLQGVPMANPGIPRNGHGGMGGLMGGMGMISRSNSYGSISGSMNNSQGLVGGPIGVNQQGMSMQMSMPNGGGIGKVGLVRSNSAGGSLNGNGMYPSGGNNRSMSNLGSR